MPLAQLRADSEQTVEKPLAPASRGRPLLLGQMLGDY